MWSRWRRWRGGSDLKKNEKKIETRITVGPIGATLRVPPLVFIFSPFPGSAVFSLLHLCAIALVIFYT